MHKTNMKTMANATNSAIEHGVALVVGFIMAVIIEEVAVGAFASDSIMSTVANNITALYIVLILALFASKMSNDVGGGRPRP